MRLNCDIFLLFFRQFWCIDNSLFKEEEHKVSINDATDLSSIHEKHCDAVVEPVASQSMVYGFDLG